MCDQYISKLLEWVLKNVLILCVFQEEKFMWFGFRKAPNEMLAATNLQGVMNVIIIKDAVTSSLNING